MKATTTTQLFVLLSFLFSVVYSQNSLSFATSVVQGGTLYNDNLADVQILSDGSFVVCGSTGGSLFAALNGTSGTDVIIVKYRADLTIVQGTQFGTENDDQCSGIHLVESTNIIYTASNLDNIPALHAINGSTLTPLWVHLGANEVFTEIAYDAVNDRLAVLGCSLADSFSNWTTSVTIFDMNGVIVWKTLFPLSGFYYSSTDAAWAIVIDSLGNIYACGAKYNQSTSDEDGWYGKLYPSGSLAWYKTFVSEGQDMFLSVSLNPNNNSLLLGGYSYGRFDAFGNALNYTGQPNGVLMSVKLSDGSLNWFHNYTPSSDQTLFAYFSALYHPETDLIYTVGITTGGDIYPPYNLSVNGGFDFFFEIFDSSGQQIRYLNVTGSPDSELTDGFDVDSQGNFIACGETFGSWGSANLGGSDFVIFKGTYLPGGPSASATPGTTTDAQKSSPANFMSGSGAIIIGVVVGGAVMIAAAIIIAVVVIKKRKKENRNREEELNVVNGPSIAMQPNTDYAELGTSTPPQTVYTSIAAMKTPNNDPGTPSVRPSSKDDWVIPFESIELEKKVGVGAFGEVFRGTWRGVEVAVKKMIEEEGVEKNLKIQDFFAEAEVMKKIKPHYNITALYGVCIQPLCIVTEFVANGSLYNWLASTKEMDDEMKYNIIKGTAAGMMHLHSHGVIHRDLAARNILLDKTLSPKVSDFGMSRVALDNKTNRTANDIGPIKWMAPEAMTDRIYNSKTDVWSFGVVIYEVLTRQSPYEGYNLMEVATGIMSGKLSLIPALKDPQKKYLKLLVDVAEECLQRDPNARPEFDQILTRLK